MIAYNSKQVDGLVLIRDGLTMVQDGINLVLESHEPKKSEKPTQQEINSLKSTEQNSSKGPYKSITKQDNQNNPAFLKLQTYIQDHNGFCQIYNSKAWIFSNRPDTLGMRKQ